LRVSWGRTTASNWLHCGAEASPFDFLL
jgi:hypothetical protein